jgi:hypothetical protein
MEEFTKNYARLSDRILFALELAVEQKDGATAQALSKALDLSMTRNSGGGEFVERRDYSKEAEKLLASLKKL